MLQPLLPPLLLALPCAAVHLPAAPQGVIAAANTQAVLQLQLHAGAAHTATPAGACDRPGLD